jgi:hypothetical protein
MTGQPEGSGNGARFSALAILHGYAAVIMLG